MKPRAHEPTIRRAILTPTQRRAMTMAVLAQTSGSVCERATTLLGGQFDEPADEQTSALLAGHLEHCDSCRAVAHTLTDLRPLLASLSSIEPASNFTADVIAATSGRRTAARIPAWSRLSRRWTWAVTFGDRAASAWQRVLARPRLSLELAYLATVLLVVVVGNPGLIADALGARANGPAGGDATTAVVGVRQPGTAAQASRTMMPTFVQRAILEVERKQESAAKGWSWFVERTSQWLSASWDWLRGLFGWIRTEDPPARTEPSKAPARASQ